MHYVWDSIWSKKVNAGFFNWCMSKKVVLDKVVQLQRLLPTE